MINVKFEHMGLIMKDIVIIGAGNFGREVAQLIEEINEDKKPGTYWDTLMKPLKNKNSY
ncbi:hypothetical protein JTS99_01190 [Clostridium botulinum]|nr:hypothetical protein [Clostridium botulinum]